MKSIFKKTKSQEIKESLSHLYATNLRIIGTLSTNCISVFSGEKAESIIAERTKTMSDIISEKVRTFFPSVSIDGRKLGKRYNRTAPTRGRKIIIERIELWVPIFAI